MRCPRCGYEHFAAADRCVRCGASLVGVSSGLPAGFEPMPPDMPTGPYPSSPANGGRPYDEPASWLASALRGREMEPAGGSDQDPPSQLPAWLSGPDWLPGNGATAGAGTSDFAPPPAPLGRPSVDRSSLFPTPSQLPSVGSPLFEQSRPFPAGNRRLGAPEGAWRNDERAWLPAGQQPQAEAGLTLKGGRYRLLQPFHAAPQHRAQGDEPPLMVALDSNVPGERVLVQEVPQQRTLADRGEQVRRLMANRFQALSQSAAVPKLVDHFAEGTRQFLVFELPAGDLLLDRLHRTRAPFEESVAIGYAFQILDALDALEREQPPLIHGNISPANVVLRPGGNVMLVGQSPILLLPPSIAAGYAVAGGVPGYSAPEQARGTATIRSDLYAVCATLQHLVTGVAPPHRANWMHPPVRRQNPNVSLELEEVLSKGLRPSATQRYGSVEDLRAALKPAAAGRRTLVPDDLRGETATPSLAPVRDQRGRLVLPRRQSGRKPLLLVALVLLLVMGLGVGTLYATMPHPGLSGTAGVPTPNQIAAAYQSRGIGVSGGELIFDAQRPNGNADANAKQAGARAVSADDLQGALTAFRKAWSEDQTDAEAAIYAENLRILAGHLPHVTVVAAVAFGADDAAARAELQGVFLAQYYINHADSTHTSPLRDNVQVRVLVLNSGANVADVPVVCHFLLQDITEGNAQRLVGIIGWPDNARTYAALTGVLKPSGLALISPTAVGDHSLAAGYGSIYFPLAPYAAVQGSELADAVAETTALDTHRVLVLTDAQSPASADSGSSFANRIHAKYADSVLVNTVNFTSGGASASGEFTSAAATASSQHYDMIYLACGDNCDADTAHLAQAVAAQPIGSQAKILVDSAAFTPALAGQGTSAVAQFVRANPAILGNVFVTLLADAGVWNDTADLGADILHIQPTISGDYGTQFGANPDPSGLAAPDATSILSYDAARLLLTAGGRDLQVSEGAVGNVDPTKVRNRLLQYGVNHPYMGVSGAIAFQQDISQDAKALIVERLQFNAKASPDVPVAQPFSTVPIIVGGKALFCGQAPNCAPS